MYRTRSIAALIAVAAAALATSASASAPVPRLLSCAGTPLLRPAGTVVLSCADGNSELKGTHWRSWSATAAVGTTDFGVNLCTPTCVASKMRFFPASTVRLLDAKSTRKGLLFTRVLVTYTLGGAKKSFTAYPAT